MGFIFEERASDSPYIESVTHGRSIGHGSTIRPAECHWHLVIVKVQGQVQSLAVGPLDSSGVVTYTDDVELLWIKFKLGTFMPHLPAASLLNMETMLPAAACQSFWLNSTAWQVPTYENVDTFVNRLVHEDILVRDPVVSAALQDEQQDIAARTLRYRFARATGLSHTTVRQIERAQYAQTLLLQGKSILDTVDEAGYFDQPHLTRALKQYIGYTPAQLLRAALAQPD